MKHGLLARKHVGEEKKRAQDKLPHLHQMEDKPVKVMLRKRKLAIRKTAQSIVNGDLMANGLLAHIDAVEVIGTEQDQKWSKKLMVDPALGRHRKVKVAKHGIAAMVNICFNSNGKLF